jgi:hypothetical protein
MERSSSLDNLQYAIFGSRKAYISTIVHVQNILWHWVITRELRVWILYWHSVSSHATDTRKSAQNNQNLMNSPLWQLHEPYNNAVHPTTSSKRDRTQFIGLQTITMSELAEYRNIWKILSFWMWNHVDMHKFTDVSEIPTASTFYSQNRGSKLFRNVSPTVHSATTRKTALVMIHAVQTSNLEICLQASRMW